MLLGSVAILIPRADHLDPRSISSLIPELLDPGSRLSFISGFLDPGICMAIYCSLEADCKGSLEQINSESEYQNSV